MQMLPVPAPLKFVAIDILSQMFSTKGGIDSFLVITDRFFKLVKAVSLPDISADIIEKAIVDTCVLICAPP